MFNVVKPSNPMRTLSLLFSLPFVALFASLTIACGDTSSSDSDADGGTGGGGGGGGEVKDNGYGPGACGGESVSKYWLNDTQDWGLDNGVQSSVKTTYACTDGQITNAQTSFWNGNSFETIEGQSTRTDYVYEAGELLHATTLFLEGGQFVLTENSARMSYEVSGGKVQNATRYFRDLETQDWILGYEFIAALSTRNEYEYAGDEIKQTTSKYYDGTNWVLEWEFISSQSRRAIYDYRDGKIDTVDTWFYDGASWYLGWETTYAVSNRLKYDWGNDGRLASTELHYYDGSQWYVGWEFRYDVSVKVEYTWD